MPPMAVDPGRRTMRARKVSRNMATVDHETRQQVAAATLDALEADNAQAEALAPDSDDDEFMLDSDDDDDGRRGKKKIKGGKRKTRGAADRRGPRSLARVLEEAGLERLPGDTPSYLTASAPPSRAHAPRKFCSVCGFLSPYTCARCGTRYCSKKCFTVHTETRCLKFMA